MQSVVPACSAFALEAARLLKERGSGVSPAPTPPPPPALAEDPEDGELPEAPGPAPGLGPGPGPEAGSRKRKHSPIVWREAGKQSGRLLSTPQCIAYQGLTESICPLIVYPAYQGLTESICPFLSL